jgi:hypothetical protein
MQYVTQELDHEPEPPRRKNTYPNGALDCTSTSTVDLLTVAIIY